MKRFDYNTHLEDVRDIWKSTPVRQGLLPRDIREGHVQAISDPATRTPFHDYPYYGIFRGGKLVAYASCLVAGEICILNDFYGHADYLQAGVVPMLVIEMIQEVLNSFPAVKYCAFGTYYGSSEKMRRFKLKFHFEPHHVKWVLGLPV